MAQSLPPEALAAALAAVHKTGVATDPNAGSPGGGGGGAPSDPSQGGGGAPPDPSQDPNAQGDQQGADPNEQAVWDEFPSTDPNAVGGLAQQMQNASPQDLVTMLDQWMQQATADTDKLHQMQESMMQHLMDLLGGPAPDGGQAAGMPTGQPPIPQGPGVTGGAGTGY